MVLSEALLTVARHEPRVLSTPPPEVQFKSIGNESLNFELLVWINEPEANEPIRSSLNFRIAYEIRERGIKIPLPTREIVFRDSEAIEKILPRINVIDVQKTSESQINVVSDFPSANISNEISTKNLRDLLRRISYFERCTEVELFALIARGYRKHFDIGQVICVENEPSEEFYIILSGAVDVFSEKANQSIATLGEGEFFGEISLLMGIPRTATVRTLTANTVLFVVERQQLQKLLNEHKELGEQIAIKLSERQQVSISLGLLNEEELQRSQLAALAWIRDRLNSLFGISLGKN